MACCSFICLTPALLVLLALVPASAAGCEPVVWVANSTERVMNGTATGDPLLPARVSLAGNEYESVQVVLRVAAGCPPVRVRVAVTPLTSAADGGSLDPVEWYQIGFVLVGDMSTGAGGRTKPATYNNCSGWGPDPAGCSGYWPDPLLPVDTALALPNFTSPLWFTVHARSGARGGLYSGTIKLSSPTLPSWRPTVDLHAAVYSFSLPETFTFSTAVQLDYEMLWHAYGAARAAELYGSYVKFALQRLHVSPLGPYDSGLGPITIGCCTPRGPVHTAADLSRFTALGGGAAKALFALPMNTTGVCSVNGSIAAAVKAVPGLSERGYLYSFDEMKPSAAAFANMQRCFHSAKATAPPGTRAATTAWIGTQYCGPGDMPKDMCVPINAETLAALDVDILVPQSNWGSNGYGSNRTAVRKAGGAVWNYISLQPFAPQANLRFDNALIDARSLMWQWHAVGATGFLYWSLNLWRTGTNASFAPINTTAPDFSPVLPPSEWNPHEGSSYIWGDGKLLYFGVDGPISSMRAENLRDAMEDMELLRMLDRVAAPAEVAALTRAVAVDTYAFTRRSAILYNAREAAARLIEARTAPLGGG